ncbi:unnamed protein product [Rotaria sordida]|uniref:Uncharacterized protein n=1 Tax=Rotaria sordida TaxID=392033 RepID=A0A813VXS3_9BILA|nr:unnamed protein product [Rotaria sordida]
MAIGSIMAVPPHNACTVTCYNGGHTPTCCQAHGFKAGGHCRDDGVNGPRVMIPRSHVLSSLEPDLQEIQQKISHRIYFDTFFKVAQNFKSK